MLDTLVESAARLCEADMAAIIRLHNSVYRHAASYGYPPKLHEYMLSVRLEPNRASVVGPVELEGKAVQIRDILEDPEFKLAEVGQAGARTILGVPPLRQGGGAPAKHAASRHWSVPWDGGLSKRILSSRRLGGPAEILPVARRGSPTRHRSTTIRDVIRAR